MLFECKCHVADIHRRCCRVVGVDHDVGDPVAVRVCVVRDGDLDLDRGFGEGCVRTSMTFGAHGSRAAVVATRSSSGNHG